MQFLYLILSVYYGRKNSLFYLIFPIALVSGYGAFIDPRTVLFGVDIFTMSKNIYKDVIILYLAIVVFLLRHRVRIPYSKTKPFILMGVYIVLLIIYTWAKNGFEYEAINVIRLFLHMILGFFLLLAVFTTANLRRFVQFFNVLFIATGVLSILYVLNSSQILPLYFAETLYREVEFGNDTFFRDFNTIPYFSNLLFIVAFASLLMQSKLFNKKAVYFVLATYPFVLLFTFTRSLLFVTLLECIIVFAFVLLRNPRKIFSKSSILIFISAIIVFLLIQLMFTSEFNYFDSRVEGARKEGKDDENFAIRIAYHLEAFNILAEENTILVGDGISKKHESRMGQVGAWTADSTIPFWLVLTGVLGVVLYYYISFRYLYMAYSHALKNPNPLLLAIIAITTFTTFSSFIMGGFRWGDPFLFFNYALIVYICNSKTSFLVVESKDKMKYILKNKLKINE